MASSTGRYNTRGSTRKRGDDSEGSSPKKPRIGEKTDLHRWRLKDDDSRHTWHYLEDDKAAKDWPQSYAEKYYLNLPLVSDTTVHLETNLFQQSILIMHIGSADPSHP